MSPTYRYAASVLTVTRKDVPIAQLSCVASGLFHASSPLKHGVRCPRPQQARPPPHARATHDKPPMTPPRVSGVSLAPVPNLEHHISNCGGEKSPGAHKLQRRPSLSTHMALGGKAPPPPQSVVASTCGGGAGGAAVVAGGCGGGAASGVHDKHQLIAEGRRIARNVSVDPWVTAYLDINGTDADSVCATPRPRLNMQSFARTDLVNGAFGPLSPCPLSPSILTLCGHPGHDDQFAISGALDLVDMRTCQSPSLPPV
jgi:hypothetical protein